MRYLFEGQRKAAFKALALTVFIFATGGALIHFHKEYPETVRAFLLVLLALLVFGFVWLVFFVGLSNADPDDDIGR